MKDYGYKTRAAAAARRRRIFDVGYLLQDLLVDRYLAENSKKHIRELSEHETEQLFMLGADLYNELFDKGDKIFLEEVLSEDTWVHMWIHLILLEIGLSMINNPPEELLKELEEKVKELEKKLKETEDRLN